MAETHSAIVFCEKHNLEEDSLWPVCVQCMCFLELLHLWYFLQSLPWDPGLTQTGGQWLLFHLAHRQWNSRPLQRTKQTFMNKVFLMSMTGSHVKSVLIFAHHITKDIIQPPIKKDFIRLSKRCTLYTLQRDFSPKDSRKKSSRYWYREILINMSPAL